MFIWEKLVYWNCGLIAGRIKRKIIQTNNVMTQNNGKLLVQVSINEFNMMKPYKKCGIISKFGGHPAACGFTLKQ